jgi:hypothetical protein
MTDTNAARTPRPTRAQLELLNRIATTESGVYVGWDPARPVGNLNPRTVQAVRRAGWVRLGPYEATRGRRLGLTPDGEAARKMGGGES